MNLDIKQGDTVKTPYARFSDAHNKPEQGYMYGTVKWADDYKALIKWDSPKEFKGTEQVCPMSKLTKEGL